MNLAQRKERTEVAYLVQTFMNLAEYFPLHGGSNTCSTVVRKAVV